MPIDLIVTRVKYIDSNGDRFQGETAYGTEAAQSIERAKAIALDRMEKTQEYVKAILETTILESVDNPAIRARGEAAK